MTRSDRVLRPIAQVALLILLAALSAFLLLRPHLGNDEGSFADGAVTEVVADGPVSIGGVRWKLDSRQVTTRLLDADREPIALESNVPGSVVVVVALTVTPLDGVRLDEDGFACRTSLRDDRGNVWPGQFASSYPEPTSCSDSDHPRKRNTPGKLVQVYVVPASAVPHLLGVEVADRSELRRTLLTF